MIHRLRRGLGRVAIAAVLTTACIAASAATNQIANGDFDNTDGSWTNNTGIGGDDLQLGGTMPPGWSAVPGRANDIWVGPANGYSLTSSPGNGSGYFLDLTGQANNQPFGGVEQTIATIPGATYVATFDLGFSSIYNGVGAANAAIEVKVDTSLLQDATVGVQPGSTTNGWEPVSFDFYADSTSTTIEFLGDSSRVQSQYAGLDNVAVTLESLPPPVTVVPEPAELAMVLAGLGCVGVAARGRRRR